MEYGNQPVSTALEKGKDEQYLNKPNGTDVGGWTHGTCSFEDEVMSLPPISLGYDQFSGRDIQDDCYFYTPDLNCIENPKVRKNWTDVSESCTEYEMLPPELSMRGDGVDCLMSPAITSMDYGNLEIPTNLTPPGCETGTAYPIKNHGAEAQSSRNSRFQMSGQFSSSRCSTSLLPLVNNFGARGNKNDINIGHLSSSSSQKIDQDFLTLGIGGGRYFRPNSNFSTREISNKLEEVSSQCNNPITGPRPKNIPSQLAGGDAMILAHAGGVSRPKRNFSARKHSSKVQEVPSRFNNSSIGHCPKNALSLSQLSGGNARFQANAGGLSISSSNFSKGIPSELEGFTFPGGPATVRINAGGLSGPACSRMLEGGLIGETGFRLDSDPFPGLHTLQTNTPTNAPSKCYTSVAEPSSMPLSSRSTLLSQPKCGSQPQIMSTYFASQPISWQQDCSRKSSMNVSSESSRNYHSHRDKLSSTSHVQPGNLSSSVEGTSTGVAKVGSFPSSVQPAGQFHAFHNISPIAARGNYISPEKLRLQLLKNSSYQSTAAGCFPKRLGLQPNDFATARRARGPYQHGISVQSSAVLPRVDNSNGQVVPVAKLNITPQVAPIISHPPLKRKAIANPSALSGQRRKIIPQPAISDSIHQQRQGIPPSPAPIHIPPAPLHVKWKGFEEALEASGQRCELCKRDLSFTEEGLMYQPTIPPPVAVLPCGHTFHDRCLQIITPEDQLKIPPCIPCAVGET